MGLIHCPKMSVRYYHYSPCNNPEVRRSQLLSGRSLKSRTVQLACVMQGPEFWLSQFLL